MMKCVRTLLCLLLSSCAGLAFGSGRTFSDTIGDSHFWQTLDWSQAQDSPVWQDRDWVSYVGKQSDAETREKIQDFRLNGAEWQATLSQTPHKLATPFQLTIYTPAENTQQDQCDALYHWAINHFGPPHISEDGSYRLPASGQSPEHRYIDRRYQWDLGTTRVTQECTGQLTITNGVADSAHLYAASSMRFTQKEASPSLHPLILAKCTRALRLTDSRDIPLKMSDITFVIDENTGSIRRPDLVPIRVRNVLVSSDQVQFSLALDKSNNDYQIERPSGILNANMSISGIQAGTVSGQCSLVPMLTAEPGQ
jgi:hypothetical protein